MLSILIGSYALNKHGIDCIPRDIDIILTDSDAKDLCYHCDKKTGRIVFFDSDDIVVDMHYSQDNVMMEYLFSICNYGFLRVHDVQLSDTFTIKCILPPLEWLYALIRGHIPRIPKVRSLQRENILIWEKYMKHYQDIRKLYGYQELDNKLDTDYTMKEIYNKEFDYVIGKIGDAKSMDQAETDFFNDSVKRYLDHDLLHQHVANINRGTEEPLFKKFQISPDSVEMDEQLFKTASRSDQLNTIREEIMVLYLERKLLPMVVENHDRLSDLDTEFDNTCYGFNEIVCHFITNLCGTGHAWLRQWCIDHYPLIKDLDTYPVKAIKQYALKYFHEGQLFLEEPQIIETLQDFINYLETVKKTRDGSYDEIFRNLNKLCNKEYSDNKIPKKRFEINNYYKLDLDQRDHIWLYHLDLYIDDTELKYEMHKTPILASNVDLTYFKNDQILLSVESDDYGLVFFNIKESLAISLNNNKTTYFIIECKTENRDSSVRYGVHRYCDSHSENTQISFEHRIKESTYYASDCYGGPNGKQDIELAIIGNYGSVYPELELFLELVARNYLGRLVDQTEYDYRDSYY